MPHIRTPDQRLRIFVSSTLDELAEERQAVSSALSALRLTAVMFEAGARPQPPSDVYRAYLVQSDVFIGLYWQQYGHMVPGLSVSGLEEELDLAREMPRLLYLKTPAPERDPRLVQLIRRIQGEASYRSFRTPDELGGLVRDDLAHLLSERFVAGVPARSDRPAPPDTLLSSTVLVPAPLPVATTSLLGRDETIHDVTQLLSRPDRRLVTLTGPSGIGKTRLAMAIAERLQPSFDGGTVFVPLEDVTDPEAVLPRIGWALGSDLTGASPVAALSTILGHDRWLIVLDNLERLVAAGPDIADLLARSPGVSVLATSTTALAVRAEHTYPVPPLHVPEDHESTGLSDLVRCPAVNLFVDRAQAVRPGFELTADHASAVVEICRRLEGLPLAIELAAVRVQLLDPADVLRRLSRSLDTLRSGMADVPPRHQTLRATVEWSFALLGNAERSLLEVLAVFAGGWTVEAAAHVGNLDEDTALELTEALARHSLLHLDTTAQGRRLRMLRTVHVFVAERLADRADADEVHRRHAEYYRAVAESADQPLRGFSQRSCAAIISRESANISTAVRWHLAHDPDPLPRLFRVLSPFRILWPFIGVGDVIVGEARSWVAELLPDIDAFPPADRAALLSTALVSALEVGDAEAACTAGERLTPLLDDIDDPYLEAVSRLLMAWASALTRDKDGARLALTDALERLRPLDEPMWTALALVSAGNVESALGHHDIAARHITEAQRLAGEFDTPWLETISLIALGSSAVLRHDLEEARELLGQALNLSMSGHSVHCLCLVLEGSAALSLAEGDSERASLMAGAAAGMRRRSGLQAYSSMRRDGDLAAAVRAATGAELFDELAAKGAQLRRTGVVALARESLRVSAPTPRGAALET